MKRFLAFVHIEKAAGTTLIHILRRSFFLRYMDVRPLSPAGEGLFSARDLKESLRVNPWVRAFGGHSVRPYGDLNDAYPGVQYVTVLRDPLKRFMSQYRYGVAVLRRDHTFEQFLDDKRTHNFQTTKIAGSQNLDKAKNILLTRFLAVGTVEQLDEFLVFLSKALQPRTFRPAYEIRNVGPTAKRVDLLLSEHADRVRRVNALDCELYDFVTNELVPAQKQKYGPRFDQDYEIFCADRRIGFSERTMFYIDGAYRKFYCEPITGIVRKCRGMTAKGSY